MSQSRSLIRRTPQLLGLLFLCTLALADHYQTLGIPKDATNQAIKKAYRKLVRVLLHVQT